MAAQPPDFDHLIRSARQGLSWATTQLHHLYAGHVLSAARRYLTRRLCSKCDPEDIAQLVWIDFFRNILPRGAVEGPTHLRALLARMARNKALKVHRAFLKRARRNAGREIRLSNAALAGLALRLAMGVSPIDRVDNEDECRHWLRNLADKEQELVALLQEGHTCHEIASLWGVSDRTVRRSLNEVKRRLPVLVPS